MTRARPAPRLFDGRLSRDPRPVALVKRVIAVWLAAWFVLASISGYRAIVQVRALELRVGDGGALRAGSVVRAAVVSSARATVDVTVELLQGARAETLGVRRVPANDDPALDPRSRRDSLRVVLTAELLGRFRPGPAVVRATGRGRSQWLRVPPPEVREVRVEIPPPSDAGAGRGPRLPDPPGRRSFR